MCHFHDKPQQNHQSTHEFCSVRSRLWGNWKPIDRIREIIRIRPWWQTHRHNPQIGNEHLHYKFEGILHYDCSLTCPDISAEEWKTRPPKTSVAGSLRGGFCWRPHPLACNSIDCFNSHERPYKWFSGEKESHRYIYSCQWEHPFNVLIWRPFLSFEEIYTM